MNTQDTPTTITVTTTTVITTHHTPDPAPLGACTTTSCGTAGGHEHGSACCDACQVCHGDDAPAAPTEAAVRAHPLYREQVQRAADVEVHADRQRAELARLNAENARLREDRHRLATRAAPTGRVGTITHEPTELGAVIVATAEVPGQEAARRVLTRVAKTCTPAWLSSTGGHYDWVHFTDARWATATERATGQVDADADQPEADHGPEAPAHPEYLDGKADYDTAPLGTQAGRYTDRPQFTKTAEGWTRGEVCVTYRLFLRRRVTRWGFGPGWEPGTDVTDRLAEAPEGIVVRDYEGDCWRRGEDARWVMWMGAETGWGLNPEPPTAVANLAPLTVATNEQLRAAGILTGSEQ